MFENFGMPCVVSEMGFLFFSSLVENQGKMANIKRNRAIKALNDYIWTLNHKCSSVTQINRELILQYCRFMVMAEEISQEIAVAQDDVKITALKNKIILYKEYNKIALNLYKVLRFSEIKDELADYGNPYTRILNEAEKDCDF